MQYWLLSLLLCCFTACTVAPQAPPTVEPVVVFLPATQDPTPQCVLLESPSTVAGMGPATVLPPKRSKHARSLSPAQITQQAEKEALVYPTERGYHAGRAHQVYPWQPGKLFSILLAPAAATVIHLPPGETLVNAITLNDELFVTGTATIGEDLTLHDVVFLRPLSDARREVNVSLLTTSGRSYDLHLIVGTTGMVAVRFELSPIMQLPKDDESTLPKGLR